LQMKASELKAEDLVAELGSVAERMVWWLAPEIALKNLRRFVAQVMTYGTWEDLQKRLKALGEPAFREVLENPPPGVFDEKSFGRSFGRGTSTLPRSIQPRPDFKIFDLL
jgi:hypothetical protein